jgi:hypothetical protein
MDSVNRSKSCVVLSHWELTDNGGLLNGCGFTTGELKNDGSGDGGGTTSGDDPTDGGIVRAGGRLGETGVLRCDLYHQSSPPTDKRNKAPTATLLVFSFIAIWPFGIVLLLLRLRTCEERAAYITRDNAENRI